MTMILLFSKVCLVECVAFFFFCHTLHRRILQSFYVAGDNVTVFFFLSLLFNEARKRGLSLFLCSFLEELYYLEGKEKVPFNEEYFLIFINNIVRLAFNEHQSLKVFGSLPFF